MELLIVSTHYLIYVNKEVCKKRGTSLENDNFIPLLVIFRDVKTIT